MKTFPTGMLAETAARFAEVLKAEGFGSVAVTGSVARGDSAPGSDLDLWVIGPVAEVRRLMFEDVPVTVMVDPPVRLFDFDYLCRWELQDLWVLSDAEGHFQRLRERTVELAPKIRRSILNASVFEVFGFLQASQEGPLFGQLLHLREAVGRIAALDVFLKTGHRVPKFRHFAAHFPKPALDNLRRLLGLARTESEIAHLKDNLSLIAPELESLTRRLVRAPSSVTPMFGAMMKWAQGAYEEGTVLVRNGLFDAIAPLMGGHDLNQDIATFLREHAAGRLADFWLAVQAMPNSEQALRQELEQVRQGTLTFLQHTRVEPLLSPQAYLKPSF